ncbi:hydrolase [Candidatus Francisella endociliophora]|uniref:Hydrolase n=1 Tax=Candidatus Francisella endociliophora TaxID=653937 RepID=A0A097ELV9_9GAMM|nr:SprT family zinc-dependent metalloprotease [Francisella sp. FSC1006]AIT08555.1 hydrolase [Francisella sp. FSC1006]
MIDYDYNVVYKDVKDITVKVKPNLTVELVAPYDTSEQHIIKILQKRDLWVHKNLDIFRQAQQSERKLVSGEDFIYLGRRYRLKVILSETNKAVLKNGYMNLYCKDTQDSEFKNSIIEDFYKTKAQEHFQKVINKFRDFYSEDVIFRIRKMKTRWGSCNPVKGYINLNQELIKKPKKAIEYVVFHEIAHLKHHNHDNSFYNYLSAYMPDWRDIKYRLDHHV